MIEIGRTEKRLVSEGLGWSGECPRQDSNLRSRLRRPLLSPLSYGGSRTEKGYQLPTVAGSAARPARLAEQLARARDPPQRRRRCLYAEPRRKRYPRARGTGTGTRARGRRR